MAIDPIRPTDDDARALAQSLLAQARFAALAVVLEDGRPQVTRIALGLAPDGAPLALISDLAAHSRALRSDPRASLLVGEPGPKGDPLTHPRLTIEARAAFVSPGSPDRPALMQAWLAQHPKAAVYAGLADFRFVRFAVLAGFLNGGFGKAFRLGPEDLDLPQV
ncbi:HugZ family pyridoxamine 5'-phosphate oxidase [Frigidibacter sp. ROC022]|uniref:HugZ family pyridoxamine 5'-phosphate oxidase n=1 Tax=Frigidibacter sp. ROC022 TaxID=2971796 RepID=UPI00215B5BC9|nr:pyridoxamine 5'-phosphate oxidase family protein [Frigidibacter sp. ROC022]MCR8722680.1 pyridoxamine 5'-phosphate oxidase family protein [Frigidibacter sp. ROC022]